MASISLPPGAAMADYQRYVHELEAMHGWLQADLTENCFLMGEEVGELFSAIRTVRTLDDADPARPAAVEHVGEEIVDVLNYLLALASRLDIDLEAAFRTKNARNQERTW